MSVPEIHNEPCDCPKGQCAHFVDNDEQCINRVANAAVIACDKCGSSTWHADGKCLRCSYLIPSASHSAR